MNEADSSAGNIEIRLKIDTSTPLTVDELGLELASQKMDQAFTSLGRLGRTKDGHQVFDGTSNVVDRVAGSAAMVQSGYSTVLPAVDSLGALGDALKHLDKVVQLMDDVATVSPDMWKLTMGITDWRTNDRHIRYSRLHGRFCRRFTRYGWSCHGNFKCE